jgi:hypothetical protein
VLSCSRGTVKSRLHRALRRLSEELTASMAPSRAVLPLRTDGEEAGHEV